MGPKFFPLVFLVILQFQIPALAEVSDFPDKLIKLGTSAEGGVFHVMGQNICTEVNKQLESTQVRCIAYPTGGTEYNIEALKNGRLQLGFAFSASGIPFPRGVQELITLYKAPLVLIARAGAGITSPSDLRGKRIGIGAPTSTRRQLLNAIIEPAGITPDELVAAPDLPTAKLADLFCDGQVDAIVESLGIPSTFYERLVKRCGGVVVNFDEGLVEKMVQREPRFSKTVIRSNLFPGDDSGRVLSTVTQKLMLVTSTDVSPEALKRFAATLLAAAPELKRLNRSFAAFNELDALPNPQLAIAPDPSTGLDPWRSLQSKSQGIKKITGACPFCDLRYGDASGIKLPGTNFDGAYLLSANLSRANLIGASLRSTSMNYADLYRSDLSGADLTKANLHRANLNETTITGANLSRTNFSNVSMDATDLSGSTAVNASFKNSSMRDAFLVSSDLSSAELQSTNFGSSIIDKSSLNRAISRGASFYQALISRSSAIDADFETADFSDATLKFSDFTNASFRRVNFRNTTLIGNDFSRADFTGADFTGSSFTDNSFSQANFCNAIMPDGSRGACRR